MPKYPNITTRKIKYKSPSGYVTIGKYIPPFEKNEGNYGFKGVVMEDFKDGRLQCCICGRWLEQLPSHISRKHKITTDEYRKRFGLLKSTALKSKRIRILHGKVMTGLRKKKNSKNLYSFKKSNSHAGNRKNKPKAVESQNKYGVCELQVIEMVDTLRKEMGRTPTLTHLNERYGARFSVLVHKRFNSYVKLCKDMNLDPNFSNHNPKYSREYFLEKALSNEASIRIFTLNESRALYKYFKGGIKELKKEVNSYLIK